jgi:predicted  nucleic acid-binding Zn-ribbon protein
MLNFPSTGGSKPVTKGHSLDFAETLQKMAELQKTDSGFDDLERLKKGLLGQIALLDAEVSVLKNRIQGEKKSLEEMLKQRKTQEIEVGTLDTKISKYLGQQNDVKSNEQFAALKQEIEKSKEDKAKAEEKVLELLFKEDEQKAKVQTLNQQLAEAEKKAADGKKDLQQKIADCDKAVVEKKEERKRQLAGIPEDFAEGYEKLRNNGKKIAVAQILEDGSCSGCHMNVSPQIVNEIRKNIAIQRCNCGRYLYVKD